MSCFSCFRINKVYIEEPKVEDLGCRISPTDQGVLSHFPSMDVWEKENVYGTKVMNQTMNEGCKEKGSIYLKKINLQREIAPVFIESGQEIVIQEGRCFASIRAKEKVFLEDVEADEVKSRSVWIHGGRFGSIEGKNDLFLYGITSEIVSLVEGDKGGIYPSFSGEFIDPSKINSLNISGEVVVQCAEIESICAIPNRDLSLKITGEKGEVHIGSLDLSEAKTLSLHITPPAKISGSIYIPRSSTIFIDPQVIILGQVEIV